MARLILTTNLRGKHYITIPILQMKILRPREVKSFVKVTKFDFRVPLEPISTPCTETSTLITVHRACSYHTRISLCLPNLCIFWTKRRGIPDLKLTSSLQLESFSPLSSSFLPCTFQTSKLPFHSILIPYSLVILVMSPTGQQDLKKRVQSPSETGKQIPRAFLSPAHQVFTREGRYFHEIQKQMYRDKTNQ